MLHSRISRRVVRRSVAVGIAAVAVLAPPAAAAPGQADGGATPTSTAPPARVRSEKGRIAWVTPSGDVMVARHDGSGATQVGSGAVANAAGLAPLAWRQPGGDAITFVYDDGLRRYETKKAFEGVIGNLNRRILSTDSAWMREELSRYMSSSTCEACAGYRLKPEAMCVKIAGRHIGEVTELSIRDAVAWFASLHGQLNAKQQEIAARVFKEIRERLGFLDKVGLSYLTLARDSGTLSGGESQRIRLASQIGSGLTGVLYVLDEPSIGLHQRDNERLLGTLRRLRDLGNTVIVVEHDEDTIRRAHRIIDLGPGAGRLGGAVVAVGTAEELAANPDSPTGRCLAAPLRHPLQARRPVEAGQPAIELLRQPPQPEERLRAPAARPAICRSPAPAPRGIRRSPANRPTRWSRGRCRTSRPPRGSCRVRAR